MPMKKDDKKNVGNIVTDYKYGFSTDAKTVFQTGKGLSEDVVRQISAYKKEPEWMTDIRIKAYQAFLKIKNPNWGPDLSRIDFDDITYYIKSSEKVEDEWDNVPDKIKDTFDKLGIPEAEQKYLAGVTSQFESEAVYHSTIKELTDEGVIFLDTDSALKKYPEIFRKYFGKAVSYTDNKYAALNTAVWSGGSFIYVPKGVIIKKPLQSYFRINTEKMGQFERTLIVVEDDASLNYVEGCTAPI
ncbi:MAG TPA: Fe-S cluster assembly protein SufB, partial [Candidatus Izemoplasmatales bacterium]|nr:Fe-S cluster assembly protein SufB [Candidatus Izemoplasmatales bacterium]